MFVNRPPLFLTVILGRARSVPADEVSQLSQQGAADHTVFQKGDGWGGVITNSDTGLERFARRVYPDAMRAKLAAFDALEILRRQGKPPRNGKRILDAKTDYGVL